eukprot:1137054-Pelagomonas_calceolata.AAC.3
MENVNLGTSPKRMTEGVNKGTLPKRMTEGVNKGTLPKRMTEGEVASIWGCLRPLADEDRVKGGQCMRAGVDLGDGVRLAEAGSNPYPCFGRGRALKRSMSEEHVEA